MRSPNSEPNHMETAPAPKPAIQIGGNMNFIITV